MGYFESLSDRSVFSADLPGVLAPGGLSLHDGGMVLLAPDAEVGVGFTIYIQDEEEGDGN